ncbi:MAG: hypothetical protein ACK5TQ_21690 [Acetobacteraceae bacterium]
MEAPLAHAVGRVVARIKCRRKARQIISADYCQWLANDPAGRADSGQQVAPPAIREARPRCHSGGQFSQGGGLG